MKSGTKSIKSIALVVILILAGIFVCGKFWVLPIPFASEIVLIIALLFGTPFVSAGYWKMFLWFLKLVAVDMPKPKVKKVFVGTLVLTAVLVSPILLISNYTSGRNIPGQTVHAEVIEKTREKSNDSEYQDTCFITFKLSDASVFKFSFAWQSDKSFHGNLHEGDVGKLTFKVKNGQVRLISFEKDPDYGGTKRYPELRDRINEMRPWQYALFNIALLIILITVSYPVVCFLIFAIIAHKKRSILIQTKPAVLVEKGKYVKDSGEDRHTVYYAIFKCAKDIPCTLKFESYSKKMYRTLRENESGLLSYKTIKQIWGDTENKFIRFECDNYENLC